MKRIVCALVAALAGLSASGAQAFSIVNQSNYAQGGARMMMVNPDSQPAATPSRQNTARSFFGNSAQDGYGGVEIYDVTRPSGVYNHMPSFPGSDNHMSLGSNAGMLMYGAVPGRR